MNLAMVGISFRTAPLEIREKVSFRPDDVPAVLQRLKWETKDDEIVLLSTCNRTELYVWCNDALKNAETLIKLLLARDEAAIDDDLKQHFYFKHGLHAVEHLFSVASSLDSMVVGEKEILGQVKQAYMIASQSGTTGRNLNPLFQNAFKVAKRVHTNTDICQGRVSVSSVAVEFAEKIFDDLSTKTVMIVGAGETGELTLRKLIEKGVADALILNRSLERGHALAEKYGGRAIQFDLLEDYFPRADIVISSTNAPHCVLRADSVRQAIASRHGRPMLLIDIAVPRDIEHAAGELADVYLYNIDDLQETASANLVHRQQAVESAKAIVRETTNHFASFHRGQNLGSLIRELEQATGAVQEAEFERAFSKATLASLPEASKEEVRDLVQRTVKRILASPKIAIREASRNGHTDEFVDAVRKIFALGNKDEE